MKIGSVESKLEVNLVDDFDVQTNKTPGNVLRSRRMGCPKQTPWVRQELTVNVYILFLRYSKVLIVMKPL